MNTQNKNTPEQSMSVSLSAMQEKFQQAFQLHQQGQLEQAEALYEALLKEQPQHVDALHFLGVLFNQCGQFQQAVALIKQALDIAPDNAAAHSNLGLALLELKRFDDAIASYDRALILKANNLEAHYGRANGLLALNRFEEALVSYQNVLNIDSDYINAHWGLSWCYLSLGDYDNGWKEYEWRLKMDEFKKMVRHFPQPQWLGEDSLSGKTILLHNIEQGFGDTLQFCRYTKQLADLGATVILEVPKPLLLLLSKLEGVDQLVEQGSVLSAFDFHCPLLSLPLAFKTRLDSIPVNTPYLYSEPEKIKHWQAVLGVANKPRVGLVWSGNAAHKNDLNRSIALYELLPLLTLDCQFISLQKELRDTDQVILNQQSLLQHYGEQINDFADTAALCELMDVVICVDTSVAHLAAAMGKPTWILLPHNPDWRWLFEREDSPWYPTVRLYRQKQYGDWKGVIERLQQELAKLTTLDESVIQVWQPNQSTQNHVDLFSQAFSLHRQGQLDDAEALYEILLEQQSKHVDALHFFGVLSNQRGQSERAVDLINQALKINPDNAAAHSNLGLALHALKRYGEAIASYDRTLSIKPENAEALYNRGNALLELKDFEPALADLERALALKSDYIEALSNRGIVLRELSRLDEALSNYQRILELKPDSAEAEYGCGVVLQDLKRYSEAITHYGRALAIKPDLEFLVGTQFYLKMTICDWSDFDLHVDQITKGIERGEKIAIPFSVLAIISSAAVQKKAACCYTKTKYPSAVLLPTFAKHTHSKIKIGYFSSDFRRHPITYLMAGLFERHDRSRFEIIAFSFHVTAHKDEMRLKLERVFDRFIDVSEQSDEQVARLARELGCDIAVDLNGNTEGCRTGIFAMRAAPVQVSYLGYLGTMGADYIDYLLADTTLIPANQQANYSEKIVYLPHSFQVNDSTLNIANKIFTREELGLPVQGFVFCCFNNNYKITPEIFASWMQILHQVEDSILWLLGDNAAAETNLRLEATKRGIAAERICFARRVDMPEYLARHRVADLFLDTHPYNAGATASAALWSGLPVLTYLGETFSGRMAASLLNAIGLPELIASNLQDYEALAIQLATQPEHLAEIKQKLANNRLSYPLFDTALFTQHIEQAYQTMFDRYQAGQAPDHIYVSSQTKTSTAIKHSQQKTLSTRNTEKLQQAVSLHQQNQLATAELLYKQILQTEPRHSKALHLSGMIANQRGQAELAIDFISQALEINPNDATAYLDIGNIFQDLGRFDEALASYDQALAVKPDYVEVFYNRGNLMLDQHNYQQAIINYDSALNLKTNNADAFYNRGIALKNLKRYDQAIISYARALTINPNYKFLFGNWLFLKMMLCDWSNHEHLLNTLTTGIEHGEKISIPFPVLAVSSSLSLQKKASEIYSKDHYPSAFLLPTLIKHAHSKIKIGYFSADFHHHATAYLAAGLFKHHDRSQFEVIAFCFDPAGHADDMRLKLHTSFDQFIDVSQLSNEDVVRLARELEIDIAVDLKGFTEHARTEIFAMRAAPIQVNYLGYPGTMSADYMDYLLADSVLIPGEYQHFYTEKIVYLPNSYQVNDSTRVISDRKFTRGELGLPVQGFVFCCFNNNYKITLEVFDSWMHLLLKVEGSVLWLLEDNSFAVENLKLAAKARGIATERLIFAKRLPMSEHLARHCLADLFLDTLPCNAHTTASDALWAGLPVLTCTGEAFASRVAASLLTAIGLPELITDNLEDYNALAIQLATHPEQLAAIKQKLANNRLTYPLFDTAIFTRHIEQAYQVMYERYQAGLAPEHIYVSSQQSGQSYNLSNQQADIQSGDADAFYNRGNEQLACQQFEQAINRYDQALAIQPNHAEALSNRGIALQYLGRFEQALTSYERAVSCKPDYVDALYNQGTVLRALNRVDEALPCYEKALAIDPEYEFLFGVWLYMKMMICDWNNYDQHLIHLVQGIAQGKKLSIPFFTHVVVSSPELQKKAAESYVLAKYPERSVSEPLIKHAHQKIKLGYFSSDFRQHPVSYLMAELFEYHDMSRFEIIAFSSHTGSYKDEMRLRLETTFDQFIDISQLSDEQVVQLARELEIDIAIDLNGFTEGCRPNLFAMRVAPIQVSYIGYLGTMGAAYIDYLLADATLIPEEYQAYYSEKIVYLPYSFQVNDSKLHIANNSFTRAELGLPKRGFVFCCFNNNYKITPIIFDSWMRILHQVDDSVLWLLCENPTAQNNLRLAATQRGIAPERICFATRLAMPDYLARHRFADLFLDTQPYNAGATASAALWSGLPVLTCLGDTFASRMGASLLNAIGLPELITSSLADYEALAIQLATHPKQLAAIKQKLAKQRLRYPLFDTALFARHIELAYQLMYDRYQAGLQPDHIYVPAQKQIVEKKSGRFNPFAILRKISALANSQKTLPTETVSTDSQTTHDNQDVVLIHFNQGLEFHHLNRLEEALVCYKQALAIDANHFDILINYGNALEDLGRFDDALASYERVLAISPDYAKAHSNRGNVLQSLKRFDEALASYDRALAIKPNYAEAFYNRGNALLASERLPEAIASYDRALQIKPDFLQALISRGNALHDSQRFADALLSYDGALAIDPDCAEALYNRGNVLIDLKRLDEALAAYRCALTIKPDYAEALVGCGVVLQELKLDSEARISYERALAIKPDSEFTFGDWLSMKMNSCDWDKLDQHLIKLMEGIKQGKKMADPFFMFSISASAALQQKAANCYAEAKFPSCFHPPSLVKHEHTKIRLAYFSADFRHHPVAYLAAELFERHDRSRFEVIAFSLHVASQKDDMRLRLEAAFDQFIDVSQQTDKQIVQLARQLEIDIAIDLTGFTKGGRARLFAMRVAPIQVNYLGFSGTMGATYMDYMLADSVLIPPEYQDCYSENIAYLPNSYMVNDSTRAISEQIFTRAEFGLPEQGFVFCCFNNAYKITPEVFAIWMRLLHQVDGSVLWLSANSDEAINNLRREANKQGVATDRLIFAKRMPLLADHLARQRLADLFLDTLPYNAHTTSSDALWAGLPVLTCVGEAFASRVAASLLTAIGVPELITRTGEEYEALAIKLATHPELLASIRQKLADNRLTYPLFNTQLFTQHIESAYQTMFERYQTGLPPAQFYVSATTETQTIDADALITQGNDLEDQHRLEEALARYERAISVDPNYARAYSNRGNALQSLNRFEDALQSYERALIIKPDYAEVFYNCGNVEQALERFDDALVSYDKALVIKPDLWVSLIARGNVLQDLTRYTEALESYDRVLAIQPEYLEILISRGSVLEKLKRYEEALACYDHALRIKPDYVAAWADRGIVLQTLKRFDEALSCYERVLAIDTNHAEVLIHRMVILQVQGRYDEAITACERVLAINPDHDFMFGTWLHNKMKVCDWRDFHNNLNTLSKKIINGEKAATPFAVQALIASPALQKASAETYAQAKCPRSSILPPLEKHTHQKIRLGYFSSDLRNHPVAHLTMELFERHDRSRFEVIAFSFHAANHKDATRLKLETLFDEFIDVSQQSDEQVARLVREMEVDIAIDLNGFTDGCRTGIFALRAAPVQASYIGYLGTMGTDYMDYLLADLTMIPEEHQVYYNEKIAYLPNSFQINDSKQLIADKTFTRAELELPEQGIVFCCFNNHFKITPDIFDAWMRILHQVPDSVLWLLVDNSSAKSNLRQQATARGIASERIVFAKRLPLAEHLARHRIADLFLDTQPYNAGATASAALWAGLPVLTYLGGTFAGRMAASLLNAIGLPELIAANLEDYEALAVKLATHPDQLNAIKQKVADNRLNTPLFDTALFTQNIESVYQVMYDRYQADLKPDHIYINSSDAEELDALVNQGNDFEDQNRLEDALAYYERAIALNPNFARAHSNRGNVLQSLKRFEEAITSYDRAIAIRADYPEAFYNRGNASQTCKRFQEAIASYERALAIKPDFVLALIGLGNAQLDCKRSADALFSYDRALAIQPDNAETLANRGVVLNALNRRDEALASYEQALAIQPDCINALLGCGLVFTELKRINDAIISYEQVIAIQPDYEFVLGSWLNLKMGLCDWENIEHHLDTIAKGIEAGKKMAVPFSVLPMFSSLALQKKAAEIYVQEKHPRALLLPPIEKNNHPRIKLAYFSSDFCNHPVALLTAGMFERHDRSRFEIIALSFSPPRDKDDMRLRLEAGFDQFIDVSQQSDEQVVALARLLEIDIAIDLNGFTHYARTDLFAMRVAPVQVSYLGYLGTMGADYIDYLLADRTLIPVEHQIYYSEKIAYLPNSFQVNDSQLSIADKTFSRAELGLPAQGFVFCCFNNNYKITPVIFDTWMRILHQVEGSVLWLFVDNESIETNLRHAAIARGIASERLCFAKRLPMPEYLARHRVADLFLDTQPYNAGATGSAALWSGLPVLTCLGETFAGRMGASLLTAIGLPELITDNIKDYEAQAIKLATHPEQLATLKQKLADNRLTYPLFDTALFTQHIEAAYQAMYDRYQADLPPDHIYVSTDDRTGHTTQQPADAANFLQAFALHQQGQLAQAETLYQVILQAQPHHADALHLMGVLASQQGQPHHAIDLIAQSLEINPDNALAQNNIGLAYNAVNRLDEAQASYQRALAIHPDFVDALYNLGNVYLARQQFELAQNTYEKALALQPDYAEVLCNRGIALQKLKRLEDALNSFERALAIKPDYVDVLSNRGNTLKDLKRWHEALASYDCALTIDANDPETLTNRGNVLRELKRLDDALIAYEQALSIAPNYTVGLYGRGVVLQELSRWSEALASYEQVLSVNPNYEFLFGHWLSIKMKMCDWHDFDDNLIKLEQGIELGKKVITPFALLSLSTSAQLQKKAASCYVQANRYNVLRLPDIAKHTHSKIKIAYFSADFRHHPVAYLIAGLIERHDHSRFEIIAFSFSPTNDKDEMRLKLEVVFDQFIDINQLSDEQVVALARDMEIDIAVDLTGFTSHTRAELFAMRLAPLQVNYLGYSATMGADYIDYMLADAVLIPEQYQPDYTEKIVYLPNSYMANDSNRVISDRKFTRVEQGLPEHGFVFCCFNNAYKITPEIFTIWMRLLHEIEGSVLWLSDNGEYATHNLQREAEKRGIAAKRLIFAQRLPLVADHLARHRLADLFLDTLPYNAHTTTSDALWAGLPVLTCAGQAFASRVAASLLNAVGLPELITHNLKDYEALAIKLATHPEQLAILKQKLADNRLTYPLFDTALFTQHIEAAYQAMYDRYQADLPPDHIYVSTDRAGQTTQQPADAASFLQAFTLHQQGQLAQAETLYQAILQAQPHHADALHLLGVLASQQGQPHQAIDLIAQSLEINPDNVLARNNIGLAYNAVNRLDDAQASYQRALAIHPDFVDALYNLGNVYLARQQFDLAQNTYDKALALQPDYAEVLCNRGIALQKLKRLEETLNSYERALAIKPDYVDVLTNRGNTLKDLKRWHEALASYDRALTIDANDPETLTNRGNVLQELRRYNESLECYDRALTINPDCVDALCYQGVALQNLNRWGDAVASYERALVINSDYSEALCYRGLALQELNRLDEAFASYERALILNPDHEFLFGSCLSLKMKICDWRDFESNSVLLEQKILRGEKAISPFAILAQSSSARLQKQVADIYIASKYPGAFLLPALEKHRHKKIKIAYFSADFYDHATAHLMAELFERHDKSRFEIIAFVFNSKTDIDETRLRLETAFDEFIDINQQSDEQVVRLAREMEIDIAIDLKGFTQHARTQLFAMRVAPIQVNYLGYPGTMGADYIDYLIADSVLIPAIYQPYYTEKVVYLPNSYQVNDSTRVISERHYTRAECELPEQGFVFCCFNNNYKITPMAFDCWMRLLHQVEDSVLWLLGDNVAAENNLRREAAQRGIATERLVFAKRMPLAEHLARHRLADLFLDTLPYNAHTTSSDALWAGLPVLTCMGEAFASRVAASLLTAVGLSELITDKLDDYEALAVQLATHPEQLALIKQKLADNRLTSPLFDTALFTQHIEAAYQAMYDRYQADLPPDQIQVPAVGL